jgi:glycosyltransferase involved in cell wall biosynthesis
MQRPKVSVVIPNYNHAPYLCERVDSVLSQTYNDLEVFILDDASSDESYDVLARYYSKPNVSILVNSRNSGTAFSQWNRGISRARGKYIWIAESDDSADPRFLETLVPLLDENPEIGLAYCESLLINKEGLQIGTSSDWTNDLDPVRWHSDFVNNGRDEVRNYLIRKNTIPNASAVLVRQSVLSQTLPVDSSFRLCGDWMHWGKMLLRADIAHVAEPLNYWRLESSNSRPLSPGILEWKEGQRVIRYLADALGHTDSEINAALIEFAERCFGWLGSTAAAI